MKNIKGLFIKRKKLAILIYSFASGGAERVVSILINDLIKDYDLTLVLMNNTIFYEIPESVNVVYIENSRVSENGIYKLMKLPLLAFKYYKFCKENKIDVSLSFMNRPNYINILSRIFGNKVKVIVSERAMPSLQHEKGIQGKINRFLIRSLYKYAHKVTANSKGNTLDLEKNFLVKNVETINNPFDIQKIQELKKEPIEKAYDEFTFISVGRLDYGKNHRLMIDAFYEIEKAHLVIVGDGPLKEELQLQIDNLNLNGRVKLLGRKNNVYKYLNKADCFVFSSLYEGFPNVLVESLACNLPIISSDCKSGPREILAPNTNVDFQLHNGYSIEKYGVLTTANNKDALVEAIKIFQKNKLSDIYKKEIITRANDFDKKLIIEKFKNIIEN